MRRRGPRLVALVLGMVLALPASAGAVLPPPPTVANFNGLPAGTTLSDLDAYFNARGVQSYSKPQGCPIGRQSPLAPLVELGTGDLGYAVVHCEPASRMYITFAEPQAYVALNAIFRRSRIRPGVSLLAYSQSAGDGGVVAISAQPTPAEALGRTPLVVTDPQARIKSVQVLATTAEELVVDDISTSKIVQPETEITAIAPSVGSTSFSLSSSFGTQFRCAIDGEAAVACTSPYTRSALAPGRHVIRVSAVDPFGTVDPSPIAEGFDVPPPPTGDADGDGVLNGADNCVEVSNADQADGDKDDIGTACELLPDGSLPPVAGRRSVVRVVSGEVFVKLPRGTGARAAQAESGFVSLKGVAGIPVGSTLDMRRGSARISTSLGRATRRTQAIVVAAGIARIGQARATRRRPRPFTDLTLQADPGAARACRGNVRSRQVVGTLRAEGSGRFRVKARVSISTIRSRALWTVQDRCDGTAVQIGRGTARIFDRAKSRAVTAKPGQRYIARGRLTGPVKGGPS